MSQEKANRLIFLNNQAKGIRAEIKKLKEEILDELFLEGANDRMWFGESGGSVSINTITEYRLADLMPKVKVDESILPETKADEYLKTTLNLNRAGKKSFRKGDEELKKIMVPFPKKRVVIK